MRKTSLLTAFQLFVINAIGFQNGKGTYTAKGMAKGLTAKAMTKELTQQKGWHMDFPALK